MCPIIVEYPSIPVSYLIDIYLVDSIEPIIYWYNTSYVAILELYNEWVKELLLTFETPNCKSYANYHKFIHASLAYAPRT